MRIAPKRVYFGHEQSESERLKTPRQTETSSREATTVDPFDINLWPASVATQPITGTRFDIYDMGRRE